MYGNQIHTVEDDAFLGVTLGNTHCHAHIDLSHNWLTRLQQGTLAGLGNYSGILYLDNNLLSAISPGTFRELNKLYSLHLGTNQLKSIVSGTLDGLFRLKNLYLESNLISYLAPGAFNNFQQLKTVRLAGNALTVWEDAPFTGASKIETLDLSSNQITFVNVTVAFPSIRWVKLMYNALETIISLPRVHAPYFYVSMQSNPNLAYIGPEVFRGWERGKENLHMTNQTWGQTWRTGTFCYYDNNTIRCLCAHDEHDSTSMTILPGGELGEVPCLETRTALTPMRCVMP